MKKALLPIVHSDSQILILGTMPGAKSLESQQYYANSGNYFWRIIYSVLGQEWSSDYGKRRLLLKNYKIALWNVIAYCEREGSQDNKIKNEIANDFDVFFSAYPTIKYVFFESKAAAAYYAKHALPKKDIKFDILPSTSGLNARMSLDVKMEHWRKIVAFIK